MGNFNYFKGRLGKVETPLNEKLKSVEWGEFRIGDLFEILSSKKIFHANNIQIYENRVKGSLPYVVRTTQNNGIKGYIIEDIKYANDKNTLSFAQDTFSVFYQKENYFTGNKVKILKPKFTKTNELIMKCIMASMQKALSRLSWGIGSTVESISNTTISLPIKNKKIDFNFMEEFIKELENIKLKKVKEYLKENNLDNPTLTKAEKEALEKFEKNQIEWGEFRIGDLFDVLSGDTDIQKKHINGKGEFVITSGLNNNGILGRSDIRAKIIPKNTFTIDMFGYAFYRPFEYKMVTHARVFALKPKLFDLTDKRGLFIVNSFRFLQRKFGYENMCSWEKVKNEKIKLPIKDKTKGNKIENIDFDFMENFIKALEKSLAKKVINFVKAKNES